METNTSQRQSSKQAKSDGEKLTQRRLVRDVAFGQ
jgi:hypothetical protein